MNQSQKNTALAKLNIDHNTKAPYYRALLSNDNSNLLVGLLASISIPFVTILSATTLVGFLPGIILASLGAGLIGGGGSFAILEYLRKRKNKKRLTDHRNRYLYQLTQAVRVYNKEIKRFNTFYANSEVYSPELQTRLARDRQRLLQARSTLRIKLEQAGLTGESLSSSSINIQALDHSLDDLLKAERALLLSGDVEAQKLLPESTDYQIELAKLDQEYPTE